MRPTGVIVGGWAYIIAAYAVTAVLLVGYALSLIQRWKRSKTASDD